ncbi:MAG: type I glutamate--ammonia ligase [Chloroflexi bacterium]|nr:type I glutamate--ammonia ligase [Chloroflexota bacterium]
MSVADTRKLADAVLARAEKDGVRFVNLQFTDIVGVVKSVTIPADQFPDAIDQGKWFDGSSIEGFARIAESDMYLSPDLTTFAVLPWERGADTTARVICWVYNPNGELFDGDPRAVLHRQLERARRLGYMFNTGPELEFFLLKPDPEGRISPLPHDRGGYFDLSTDLAIHVRKEMVNVLQALGIRVETSHHEVAMGQHEIDFEYGDALRTADNAVTFKYALKAVAQRHGLHATFMPKPIYGINGSGMHCHQSIAAVGDGGNLFSDPADEYGLSELARRFIAGQLQHAPGMCAVLAPLVNSYKRLVPGFEAPVYISWARVNRSALIRVPKTSPARLQATRIELRCPDPSCNPYLAFAVMLATGLDGIERTMPFPEPVEENLYHFDESELSRREIRTLPATLADAITELEHDEVVLEALGEHVASRFIEAKRFEWDQFRAYVSPWELDRYLEIY